MTGNEHRPSVPDRARRRAIRAHAARLGVSYSVAARLLRGQMSRPGGGGHAGLPIGGDNHREWVFAMRERRSFDLRVRDTRLAADLPMGRATHLVRRFPPLRRPHPGVAPLYDGDSREETLAMLYTVLVTEARAPRPTAEELAWVAELGEEAAVDIACAALDRAARLLLDGDRWGLWTRIETALAAGETSHDRRVRDAAITLGLEFRAVALRRSLDGARHTLDALLVAAHEGHPPGTRVRIRSGPDRGRTGTVVGAGWRPTGPPTGYAVRADAGGSDLTLGVDEVAPLDRPAAPEPALT
jgi:hypothetical protein